MLLLPNLRTHCLILDPEDFLLCLPLKVFKIETSILKTLRDLVSRMVNFIEVFSVSINRIIYVFFYHVDGLGYSD